MQVSWARAEIISEQGEEMVTLAMVDDGCQCRAPRRLLKPLAATFSKTPAFSFLFEQVLTPGLEMSAAVLDNVGVRDVIERLANSSDSVQLEVSPNCTAVQLSEQLQVRGSGEEPHHWVGNMMFSRRWARSPLKPDSLLSSTLLHQLNLLRSIVSSGIG